MQAIVLGSVRYGESSIITQIYTDAEGSLSAITSGKSGAGKAARTLLSQPLAPVELELYSGRPGALRRVKEAIPHPPLLSLPFNPTRRMIALFCGELLCKALPLEAPPDPKAFRFVREAVLALDNGLPGEANLHLFFMYRLMALAGLEPDTRESHKPYFDLASGTYESEPPIHRQCLEGDDLALWRQMADLSLCRLESLRLNSAQRQRLIEIMQTYYSLHLPWFRPLKSHEVLHEVLA